MFLDAKNLNKTIKTTCPYCGVGCGILATPQADGTVDIKGDPDHPANFGRLCSKGSALAQTIDLDGRLLHPEINGKRVEWSEALDLVADKFSTAIREHGPDSVAFYVSGQILTEDYYVANKLMKGFIGSANIDTNSRLCMASSVAGHKRAFGSDTVPGNYEDLELADLILIIGSNLAWCHPVLYQRIAAAKLKRPEMKVVLIDPRRTMTADLADMHLAIAPDGDVALFQGLLAFLVNNGALHNSYVEAFTNGFDAALASAEELSLAQISAQTGLDLEELLTFYKLFTQTDKTVSIYSQGVNQSVIGTDKVNAIINCHLATGRIGKPGMGPFSVTGQPNAMGGREVGGLANMLANHMELNNFEHRSIVQNFWKSPTIADKPGLKAVDLFDAVAKGNIKALWIMSTNPVDSMPNATAVEDALKNCPFVVASDIMATTDTIRHAHVKLPAAGWGEKSGTVTNSERRISRQRPFSAIPGQAKPDWWHLAEVAKRMGFAKNFPWTHPAEIFAEHAKLSTIQNNGTRDFDIGAYADIEAKNYENLEPFQWPQPQGASAIETRFFAKGQFFTANKKANFIALDNKVPVVLTDPDDLTLNTGRVRDHWHTMTRTAKSERLSAHMAEPYCEIHPSDAAIRSINSADLVTVESPFGEIIVRALISDRQRLGSVFVPMHWTDQVTAKGRVDTLIPPVVDPISGQPATKNIAVKVAQFIPALHGYGVFRDKPDFGDLPYWTVSKCEQGWRVEFAVAQSGLADNILLGLNLEKASVGYRDQTTDQQRYAWFDDDQLTAAIFLSRGPVSVSRIWAVDMLKQRFENLYLRHQLIAGRASEDQPDRGAIICSCFSVGANEIATACQQGALTVDAIGKCLSAGTNCGSCRSEIQGIIDENHLVAAQ